MTTPQPPPPPGVRGQVFRLFPSRAGRTDRALAEKETRRTIRRKPSYSQLKPRSQARFNRVLSTFQEQQRGENELRLFAGQEPLPEYTRAQAMRDFRSRQFDPFARQPEQRMPQRVVRGVFIQIIARGHDSYGQPAAILVPLQASSVSRRDRSIAAAYRNAVYSLLTNRRPEKTDQLIRRVLDFQGVKIASKGWLYTLETDIELLYQLANSAELGAITNDYYFDSAAAA